MAWALVLLPPMGIQMAFHALDSENPPHFSLPPMGIQTVSHALKSENSPRFSLPPMGIQTVSHALESENPSRFSLSPVGIRTLASFTTPRGDPNTCAANPRNRIPRQATTEK